MNSERRRLIAPATWQGRPRCHLGETLDDGMGV
jgi:hypothetical protein